MLEEDTDRETVLRWIWTQIARYQHELVLHIVDYFWDSTYWINTPKIDRENRIEINHEVKYKEVFVQAGSVNKPITVQQGVTSNMSTGKSTVLYNKAKLFSIANKVRGDPRYKVINSTTCNNIRKIKQQKRL